MHEIPISHISHRTLRSHCCTSLFTFPTHLHQYAETLFSIDPTSFLNNSPVYLYSGTKDTVVNPGVMQKLEQYYTYYGANVKSNFNIASEHAFITNDYGISIPLSFFNTFLGNSCTTLASPYINNCNFDLAGAILQQIYGPLKSPVTSNPNNVTIFFNLKNLFPRPSLSTKHSLSQVIGQALLLASIRLLLLIFQLDANQNVSVLSFLPSINK